MKIQLQDYKGNILTPQTDSSMVKYGEKTVGDIIKKLDKSDAIICSENKPIQDCIWIDTNDTKDVENESGLIDYAKKYFNKTLQEQITALSGISNKNLIINGSFDIWNRGESFDIPNDGEYHFTADRWKVCSNLSKGQVKVIRNTTGHLVIMISNDAELKEGFSNFATLRYTFNELSNTSKTKSIKYMQQVPSMLSANGFSTRESLDWGVSVAVPTIGSGSKTNIDFNIVKIGAIEIEWIKMEEGIRYTGFIKKDYAQEKQDCSRYLLKLPKEKPLPIIKVEDDKYILSNYYEEFVGNPTLLTTEITSIFNKYDGTEGVTSLVDSIKLEDNKLIGLSVNKLESLEGIIPFATFDKDILIEAEI